MAPTVSGSHDGSKELTNSSGQPIKRLSTKIEKFTSMSTKINWGKSVSMLFVLLRRTEIGRVYSVQVPQ
jgi:hypothetical protein